MTRRIRYPDIDAAVNQGMSDFEPARLRGFPCGFRDETALITESNMNDALFCSVPVDGSLPRDAMASLVAELTGGVVSDGGVDLPWGRIAVDDDYGMFEIRAADPDDFLGWPILLEIMPSDGARREDVVPAVASLMNALIARGMRVLAQCEYADDLPGRGDVTGGAAAP